MVQIYRNKWQRGLLISIWHYVRDFIVLTLPVKKLPYFWVKLLYGFQPHFAFFVHPRNYEDIYVGLPFLKFLKFLVRRKDAYKFFLLFPPFVVSSIRTNQNINGFVMAQLTVPEVMVQKRRETFQQLKRMLLLFSKLSHPHAVIGLGGWFPMITRRGAQLKESARKYNLSVTNGHCGTLGSIFMTVEKISSVAHLLLSQLNIAIIGVGKMGSNIARAFNGKVQGLILIDINRGHLMKLKESLERDQHMTKVEICHTYKQDVLVKNVLSRSHLGICATSTFRNIFKLRDLPPFYVAIDDSRPEALPRDPRNEKIILEGGLLKVNGAVVDYDYGFGEGDNVFGCLGEAFLLALDQCRTLKPTLGEVDMENFFNMVDFCRHHNVKEGDFKSSNFSISESMIRDAINQRHSIISDNSYPKQ
jgi:predicted amino acid dehydrogenase